MGKTKFLHYLPSKSKFYAIYSWREEGKQRQLKQSLKTSDETIAKSRLPEAVRQLKAKARGLVPQEPIKASTVGLTLDDEGNEITITAGEVLDASEFELTNEDCLAIHLQRSQDRRGQALAPSSVRSIRNAMRGLDGPLLDITVGGIRSYMDKLRSQGLSALTIMQRCSLLSAVTTSVIRRGYLPDDYQNNWEKIDYQATSKNHIHTATPEECKQLMVIPEARMLLYTGLRTSELANGIVQDGWITITEHDSYRPKTASSQRRLPLPFDMPKVRAYQTQHGHFKRVASHLSAHSLRHAFRTACREAQLPTELSEYLMGHSASAATGGALVHTYGQFSDQAVMDAMQKVWAVLDGWTGLHTVGTRQIAHAPGTSH